jgi:membrane carboxypeptidase/penicillin-binding protein
MYVYFRVLANGTQFDKPFYILKINDNPNNIMTRNKHITQQQKWRDLHNKHEVDMHYFPSFCRLTLFDLLEKTLQKKKVDDVALHQMWV